jgi:hypothetical protein
MEQSKILQQLRGEVQKTQKTIVQMKSELEATRRLADFDSTYEELAAQKRQMDCAVRMLKARVDDLKADLSVKQGIIK